jgi:formamidopyrimidine-DNA glycosylase
VPELPEVETVRTRLAPDLEGRTILRARVDDTRLVRPELPEVIAAALTGETVERVDRRGKYLLLRLAGGETLAVHLRMTGNLLRRAGADEPPRFVRAELELDDGSRIAYTDVRRFGTWELLRDLAIADDFIAQRLGPEPFSDAFTPAFLHDALQRRNAPVKPVLLDQRVVAGLGNIYADEALWAAKVHPEVPASRLRRPTVERLHGAIRHVLTAGIEAQGASIRDYRMPDGGHGSAQERFAAYGRTGLPCPRCGTRIRRLVVGQRGTHICPHDQRLPRVLRAPVGARGGSRAID